MLMRRMKSISAFTTAAVVLATAACSRDTMLPTESTPESPAAAVAYSTVEDRIMGKQNPRYQRVANAVAGYANHTLTRDGRLIIHLTDTTQSSRAVAALADEISAHSRAGRSVRSIEVRKADYDFRQQVMWRKWDVPRIVGQMPGVWLVRTNREANVIEIGVDATVDRGRLLRAIERAGVPAKAVQIIETEQPESGSAAVAPFFTYAAALQGPDSLTKLANPMEGGRRYFSPLTWNGAAGVCTAGPVGEGNPNHQDWAGRTFMLMASHCSARMTHSDPAWTLKQPNEFFSQTLGNEWIDPREYAPGDTNSGGYVCPYADGCSLSDVSVAELNLVPVNRGYISRPKATASKEIHATIPDYLTYSILVWPTPQEGSDVTMVGQTSGLRTGEIIDENESDLKVSAGLGHGFTWLVEVCSADYTTNNGDSGAPVFQFDSQGRVVLVGINNGRVSIRGVWYAYFSSTMNIYNDFKYFGTLSGYPNWLIFNWISFLA